MGTYQKTKDFLDKANGKFNISADVVLASINESVKNKYIRTLLLWFAAFTLRKKGMYSFFYSYMRLAGLIVISRPSVLSFLVSLLCKDGSEIETILLKLVSIYETANVDYFIFIIATIVFLFVILLQYQSNKFLSNGELMKRQILESIKPIMPFSDFLAFYKKHGVKQFVDNDVYKSVRATIANYNKGHVRLLALSGTGKTFLIQSAFLADGNTDSVFYCDAVSHPDLLSSVVSLAKEFDKATLILDNCPSDVCDSVIKKVGDTVRIVSAYYDPNDVSRESNPLSLDKCDMQAIIETIIDDNIAVKLESEQREMIINHSGNIPFMALLLVQAFNKSKGVYDTVDTPLMNHLLDISGQHPVAQRIAMRTLALCQPFNFDNANSEYAKYLMESDNFTPIEENLKGDLLFRRVVQNLYSRNLVDLDSVFVNVRPQPLAIWLVGEWIKDQGSNIINTLRELEGQPEHLRKSILENMSMRLEYMQGNPDADRIYADLVAVNGGPFANEDVVCSDFGSRLILAMSTVNPVAVIDCLYAVLFPKTIEWLQSSLINDARRNIVHALEKLSFCRDSFKKAACLLARLALAENEEWANNSKGQFMQLFHIFLAGTESDLNDRFDVLRTLYEAGSEYHTLLLTAIKGCFAFENLHRFGGAEKFGFKELVDYRPNNEEISQYWENIYGLLIRCLNENQHLLDSVSEVVLLNTRTFIRAGKADLLFRFLDTISPKKDFEWDSMHKSLNETLAYDSMSKTTRESILFWVNKLEPKSTISRMKNAVHSMYVQDKCSDRSIQREEEICIPYVKEFVDSKQYLGPQVAELLNNEEYISWSFIYNLAKSVPEEGIEPMGENLLKLILEKEMDFYNGHLISLYGNLLYKNKSKLFIEKLYSNGYYSLALPLMAVTDSGDRASLINAMKLVARGNLTFDEIRKYLSALRLTSASEILDIVNILKDNGADVQLLFDFIAHYWYLDELYTNAKLLNEYKQVLFEYPIVNNSHYNYEYSRMVQNVLEKTADPSFAVEINKKLIDVMSKHATHNGLDEIYDILLTKYRNNIWPDFISALVDWDNRAGFYFQVHYKIGSGFEFGEGSLFDGHEDEMKLVCQQYPKYGPLVCAGMCPVFSSANPNTGLVESFHPFVLWLFENYGTDKRVLDEFHSNMGTFHWTGSTIPLIEDRRRSFENLKSQSNMPSMVKEWADLCIKENDSDFQRESKSEAYMRLAYGKQ